MNGESKRVKDKLHYLFTLSSSRPDANSSNANADCASFAASFSRFITLKSVSQKQLPVHDSHAHSGLVIGVLHIHLATIFFFPLCAVICIIA